MDDYNNETDRPATTSIFAADNVIASQGNDDNVIAQPTEADEVMTPAEVAAAVEAPVYVQEAEQAYDAEAELLELPAETQADVQTDEATVTIPAPVKTPEEMVAEAQALRDAEKPVEAPKPKSKRGFASMTPERRREIAAKGGRAVPKESRYFAQSHANASEAGKVGGKVKGPRKPKPQAEAIPQVAEAAPTVAAEAPMPVEQVPTEHTVFDTVEPTPVEAPEAAPVVETQDEVQVAAETAPEPTSPADTITEGEPEIPAYLRRLAGGATDINI
jgi:general stress protein YciG